MDEEKDEKADMTPSNDKSPEPSQAREDAWERLRGIGKDVFAELGGGEAFIRNERDNFYSRRESK
jgi:hypothetical protein